MSVHKHINTSNGGAQSLSVTEGDNYFRVIGDTADGRVDRSILKDDPDCETKLRGLVDDIEAHQRAKIQEWADTALSNYDTEVANLESQIDEHFAT